jgi:hypothetical protein
VREASHIKDKFGEGAGMARGISVYRRDDVVEVPPDDWGVREGAEDLCDRPLGNESDVQEFWSGMAIDLDLPLLTEVSGYGFYHGIRWSGEQLRAAAAEVDQLEAYWSTAEIPDEKLADLRTRAGFMREALAVAAECSGWVVIA